VNPIVSGLSPEGFLNTRATRRRLAEGGGPLPELLSGWRFADDPIAVAALIAALDAGVTGNTLSPPAHRLALAGLPGEALLAAPALSSDASSARLARLRLDAWAAETAPEPAAPVTPRVWALVTLADIGADIELEVRGAWRQQQPPAAADDVDAAALWQRWPTGGPALWAAREPWEARYLDAAVGAFRQVLASRELPPERVRSALADLREGFWFQLLGGSEGAPGWAELAARVLETAPPGPVEALTGSLGASARAVAGRCASARGYWPSTLERLLSDVPGRKARGLTAAQQIAADPARSEALLDLHVALRLVAGWQRPGGSSLSRDWQVIRQNRGRGRGRLRALVTAAPEPIIDRICGLEGLHERTLAATRRWAWDWSWEAMARGLELDFTRPVSAPCQVSDASLTPLEESARPAAETWILLVALKGRLGHLQRWTRAGGTGDRDGTWGRLLNEELPDSLRDADGRYHRLRAWLAGGLDEALAGWTPTLSAIAALRPGRALKAGFHELLRARWDDRVRFPSAGFPTFRRNAAAALDELDAK